MSNEKRFPLTLAQAVANSLQSWLSPAVERIAVAGSVRRDRADVGDLDLILIPWERSTYPIPHFTAAQ